MVETLSDVIREVIAQNARLVVAAEDIADDDDLHRLGLSSQGLVAVMLGLEDELGVQFPDEVLSKDTFSSIASIRDTLARITDDPA
ncbi:MAG: acyl carrier protein [Acidimicrobiales bacterium]